MTARFAIDRLRPGRVGSKVIAEFDCDFGVARVRDVRLVEGAKGRFLSMPSRKDPDGRWYPLIELDPALLAEATVVITNELAAWSPNLEPAR